MKPWLIGVIVVIVISALIWYFMSTNERKLPKYLKSSQRLVDYIRNEETFQPLPYEDPPGSGKKSIAYGHQVEKGEEWMYGGVSVDQGEEILKNDLVKYEAGVARAVTVPVDQGMFDALVDIFYNEGIAAMSSSTLVNKLNSGEPQEEIISEFNRWIYVSGEKNSGVQDRRSKEISWFA